MKGSAILPIFLAALAPIFLLAFLASGIGFGLVTWQPPVLWTHTFGNATSGGNNAIVGVSADSSGAYSAAYSNYSGVGYPGGILHLNKYDPFGGVVWTHVIGNSGAAITGISIGTDGIYLVGVSPGDDFVQKFDFAGNKIWTTNSSRVQLISATTSVVYAASVESIQEFDLKGNLLWTTQMFNGTTTSNGEIYSIHADGSGVYVAGGFSGNLTGQTPTGGKDVFIVKYGLSGGLIWVSQIGTTLDHAYGVSSDSTGVYLSGNNYGALPPFGWLRKLDSNGNLQWTIRIDSLDGSGVGDSSILADESGVYVSVDSIASREYLMKYDHQGNQAWSFQMGGVGNEIYGVGRAYRLSLSSGALYVAGSVGTRGNSIGFLSRVSTSPSLIAFGFNPPFSFIILGGLVAGSAMGLVVLKRLRHRKPRIIRMGSSPSSLPTTD